MPKIIYSIFNSKPSNIRSWLLKSRYKVITVVGIIITAGITVLIVSISGHGKSNESFACSNSTQRTMLHQAALAISSNNINRLSQMTASIKGFKGYEQDPNCLYIVDNYYLDIGDLGNAKKYLTDFNKAYRLHPELSTYLTINANASIRILKSGVSSLSLGVSQAKANTIGLP